MSHGHESQGRLILRLSLTSGVIAALVTLLHQLGYFYGVESRWIDVMGLIHRPAPTNQVAVVTVTDADFAREDLFASVSPMDPKTLRRTFERIADHRPAVAANDIQLQPVPHESGERLGERRQLYRSLASLVKTRSIQWILLRPDPVDATLGGIDPDAQADWSALQQLADASPKHLWWASSVMQAEEGLIRHMSLNEPASEEQHTAPTILGAIVETRTQHEATRSSNHPPLLIRYTGAFGFDRGTGLTPNALSVGDLLAPETAPKGDTILTGKTLIVGGSHHVGHDYHWTLIGYLPAVQIWAEAVDTFIRNDAPQEPHWLVSLPLETAVGIMGGWLMVRFSPMIGYALTLLILAPLTIALASLAFGTGLLFVNFLPSFLAVRLHQRIESWYEVRTLRHQVADLERELRILRSAENEEPTVTGTASDEEQSQGTTAPPKASA